MLMRLRVLFGLATLLALGSAQALPPSPYTLLLRPLEAPKDLNRFLPQGWQCPPPTQRLERLLFKATAPVGGQAACANVVGPLLFFPQQDVSLGSAAQPSSPHGAFDLLAEQIRGAQREVLLSNMFWDDGPEAPGRVLARAIADLRAQVQRHPERYPRGVVVRLLLGNGIGQGGFDLNPHQGLQALLRSLQAAGLPMPGQPESVAGFHLEVSSWPYLTPHSHVKLLILDGRTALIGGYNVTSQHLPPGMPDSQNTHDLALTVSGPAARQAAATFDDLWEHSRRVECRLQRPTSGPEWYCPPDKINAASTHTWLTDSMPVGSAWAFPLYRRSGFENADSAIEQLLGAADTQLDLLQSQVSGTFGCTLTWGAPSGCRFPQDALPMWRAVLDAIEQRHIHVRLLIDEDPGTFKIEGQTFVYAMRNVLNERGLSEYFEVRYFSGGRLHSKVILVDKEMAALGSYNLHYSSQGPEGLNEYAVATSDAATVSQLQQLFEAEWKKSKPVTLPWWQRLTSGSQKPG